jgi:hypothetical protein
MSEGKLKKYKLEPPEDRWLFKDGPETIYADVFPQKPDQLEDLLTEATVKDGYTYVSALRVIEILT